jgi:FkbM family methyltransferase
MNEKKATMAKDISAESRGRNDCRKNIFIALLFLGLAISNISNAFAPPSEPSSDLPSIQSVHSTSIADGCYHVFLDVGANIGVHSRFLFAPEKYPDAQFASKLFNDLYGMATERDNRDFCAISFEPNPAHRARHKELQLAYQAMGWRYIPILTGVGDHDGNLTFYHQNDEGQKEWGFSTQKFGPDSTAEIVPVIHLSKFLIEHIRSRTIPNIVYGKYVEGPKVLMKMDVEGMEYFIVPDMIASGALCTTVDYIFGEVHYLPQFFPLTLRSNKTLSDGWQSALDTFDHFLSAMDNAGNCRTQKFHPEDDESYLHDGLPLPVPQS